MKNKWLSYFLQMIIVLLGISFLTFSLTYLSPGDPVKLMYSAGGLMPSEEIIEQTRANLGLNRPFMQQYVSWLVGVLHADFGISYISKKPVSYLLGERLLPTLMLSFSSLVLMLIISIPLGIVSAIYHNKWFDYIIRGATFVGVSIPGFWLGLMLLRQVAVEWKLLPVASSGHGIEKIILPAITLALIMSAKYTRQVRTAVLEELNQDYVVGVRARGMKESCVLWKHVLPNAMLPLITMLGLSLGSLLGGTAIVEIIFSYPGLGNLAVTAITQRDYQLVQGYVLWIAFIYMIVNFFVDLSYHYIDPRIREEKGI